MKASTQRRIVEAFRDPSVNLLFATSVVEEGLDVRACNTVIMFDAAATFKGRLQVREEQRYPGG